MFKCVQSFSVSSAFAARKSSNVDLVSLAALLWSRSYLVKLNCLLVVFFTTSTM